MNFTSKFPGLYKGTYDEERVASWPDLAEVQRVQHAYPKDAFCYELPREDGQLRPTHYTVKVPPNTLTVYYPNPDEHTIFSHFRPGETVLYLGELQGMSNHGVFVDRDGRIRDGYHLWSFRVIPHEEL